MKYKNLENSPQDTSKNGNQKPLRDQLENPYRKIDTKMVKVYLNRGQNRVPNLILSKNSNLDWKK